MTTTGVLEEEHLADPTLFSSPSSPSEYPAELASRRLYDPEDFDADYGLIAPEDSVIIRPYGGEDDDILLQELRPRFVVMYEPNLAFIRRLEVSFSGLDSLRESSLYLEGIGRRDIEKGFGECGMDLEIVEGTWIRWRGSGEMS